MGWCAGEGGSLSTSLSEQEIGWYEDGAEGRGKAGSRRVLRDDTEDVVTKPQTSKTLV